MKRTYFFLKVPLFIWNVIFLLVVFISVCFSEQVSGQAFRHPGILNSKEQLDFIKAKIKAEEQPWKDAFDQLKKSHFLDLNFRPEPFPRVDCGSYNKPNLGCNQMVEDGMAAYCQALMWIFTNIWRSLTPGTVYIDGLGMETCRDLGHLNLGFSSMMYAAEIAWQQGVDLFAPEQKRLTDFMELHGSWMTGAKTVPSDICGGMVKARLADKQGIKAPEGGGECAWEIAYNQLHDRLKIPLPYTLEMIGHRRPAPITRWVSKGETLTHANRIFTK